VKTAFEDYDQLSVVALEGDLTGEYVDQIRRETSERLTRRQVRDFVLDLDGMETIDSQGLETLIWLQESCAERLGQLRLARAREHVVKILELTRLAARFDCHPSVDEAIKSLR
jgi:anti-anti-sigma factor